MTPSKSCRDCGEVKAAEAFERLPSGGYRGTCIDCRKAKAAERKQAQTRERKASPQYRALIAQRERDREERTARKHAAQVAAEAERVAAAAAAAARKEAARLEREEREAVLRDDIWSAMRRGRARRTAEAAQLNQTGIHKLRLRDGSGFISVAEMACRCIERDATYRAAANCKTFESAAQAQRILEQPVPASARIDALRGLWSGAGPRRPLGLLMGDQGDEEADAFEEALGDWAPSWLAPMPGALPAASFA